MKETIQLKTCTKCGGEKPISEFGKNLKQCKKCWNLYQQEHRAANREKYRANDKKYYNSHKKECAIKHKKWSIKNKDHLKDYMETWRSENPTYMNEWSNANKESVLLSGRKWSKSNPEKVREKARKRRAKKLQLCEDYTKDDEKYTQELFGYKCANCGSTNNLTIDHHYPLTLNHPLTKKNAVVLCQSCNSSKQAKLPEEFYDKEKLLWIESKLNQFE